MPNLRESSDMNKYYNDNQLIIAFLKPIFTILLDETKCTKRMLTQKSIQEKTITLSLKNVLVLRAQEHAFVQTSCLSETMLGQLQFSACRLGVEEHAHTQAL